MTDEREEALRLALEAGVLKHVRTGDGHQWAFESVQPGTIEAVIRLIRLARQSAPQGEPIAKVHAEVIDLEADKCEVDAYGKGRRAGLCWAADYLRLYASSPAQADVVRDALRWRAFRDWPYAQTACVPGRHWPTWGPNTEYPTSGSVMDDWIDKYISGKSLDAALQSAQPGEKSRSQLRREEGFKPRPSRQVLARDDDDATDA